MLCPLEIEGPLSARMNKQEPLELHWRKQPPTCRGNIEKAYYRAYPDLVEKFKEYAELIQPISTLTIRLFVPMYQVLCFQCGAVPCPYNHDDSDKKQRLVDLEFVKELAKERREMKEELKRMQDKMSEMQENEDRLVLDKTVLRHKVENYEKLEQSWNSSRIQLEAEIKRLRLTNEQNVDYMNEMRKEQQKMKALYDEVDALTDANKRLQQENELCNRRLTSQAGEISELMKENQTLTEELEKVRGKAKKLMVQIQQSNVAIQKLRNQLAEKEAKVTEMEKQIKNLVQELMEKTKLFQEKEVEFENLVKQLKDMIDSLQKSKAEAEDKNKELLDLVNSLQNEIEMLKKKLASDTRFRQFVEIKRECNVLKDMSGNLAQKVQQFENKRPLPTVKKSGKITRKSSAYGPGSRPPTAILGRQKETKVPVRPTDFESGMDDGELADLADFDDDSRPSSSQLMRPKSAMSSQFRSPTQVSFTEEGDYSGTIDDTYSRPGSGLHRSKSARQRKLVQNPDFGSPTWSRTPSRMSSASPSLKRHNENVPLNGDIMTGFINEDTLGISLEDIKDKRNCDSRLTCTPNSSIVGSDFEFKPLEI